nr:hypothetical protein CFP56_43444 [Quercus suber]
MVLSMESLPPSYEENNGSREYEIKCREKYSNSETESISDVAGEPYENTQKTRSQTSSGEKTSNESIDTPESSWETWKRGSIIGAAALTGGTLMAITGGLAAPAVAQGLGALAPTLGSVVPAIGASEFAAAASATGSLAGSAAVAASFGVGILVLGLVIDVEDFIRPWEGHYDNLERSCIVVNETRCHDDRTKHTCGGIGFASYINHNI